MLLQNPLHTILLPISGFALSVCYSFSHSSFSSNVSLRRRNQFRNGGGVPPPLQADSERTVMRGKVEMTSTYQERETTVGSSAVTVGGNPTSFSVSSIWGPISRDKVRHETATKWSFNCKRISTLTFTDILLHSSFLPTPKAAFHLADYASTARNIIFFTAC